MFSRLYLGLVLLLAGPAAAPQPPITIQHNEAVVKRTMFDRAHPPSDMPKLSGSEAALTESRFLCGASVDYEITKQKQSGDHWRVTAKIRAVTVRTSLTDMIFLPQLAPLLLRAHEEGHRQMNEDVYKTADTVARNAAAAMIAREWEADGPDVESAGKQATDAAVNWMCEQYLAGTAKRASRLGDIYDKITDHGLNRVMVANAIRLSYEQEKKEAATRPVIADP